MGKIVKGHVVQKRYNPAKPDGGHAQLSRADDEFQLLLQQGHDAGQVWVDVSEDEYHAANVGDMFHAGHHVNLVGARGARKALKAKQHTDPTAAAADGLARAVTFDLSGW